MRLSIVALVLASGCAPTFAEYQRASFELNCPEQQLTAIKLPPTTVDGDLIGVTGCGRRALYRWDLRIGGWSTQSVSAQ
ncbi:MAG TPA: hypothetical protein VFF06_31510 [Polyangia bacterium]|nr:hypothetical protein [Polyangia bacterium]